MGVDVEPERRSRALCIDDSVTGSDRDTLCRDDADLFLRSEERCLDSATILAATGMNVVR